MATIKTVDICSRGIVQGSETTWVAGKQVANLAYLSTNLVPWSSSKFLYNLSPSFNYNDMLE